MLLKKVAALPERIFTSLERRIARSLKKIVLFGAIVTAILGFLIVLAALDTLSRYDMRLAIGGGAKLLGGAVLMGLGGLSLTIYLKTFKDEISGTKK